MWSLQFCFFFNEPSSLLIVFRFFLQSSVFVPMARRARHPRRRVTPGRDRGDTLCWRGAHRATACVAIVVSAVPYRWRHPDSQVRQHPETCESDLRLPASVHADQPGESRWGKCFSFVIFLYFVDNFCEQECSLIWCSDDSFPSYPHAHSLT